MGMRSGTPVAALAHVLTSTSDNDSWKKYLNMRDDTQPGVMLLDASGRARWSFNGGFDPGQYLLEHAVEALLEGR